MDLFITTIKKAKCWQEIKSLQQEHNRNISQIEQLKERQLIISSEIQNRLDSIQHENEKFDEFDEYCYENKLGEFSE